MSNIERVVAQAWRASVDADSGHARGLPNEAYVDEAWFALEQRRLFRSTWMLVGFVRDVPQAGDVLPTTVAGCPILLVRDDDGAVRAFHNVCRHRGAILAQSAGRGRRVLTCPYHGWTYSLDGKLNRRPHFFGGDRHDPVPSGSQELGLRSIRCATWNGLLFVDIGGNAVPLDEHLKVASGLLLQYPVEALRFSTVIEFAIAANWKLVLENYTDNYHIFRIHPTLDKTLPMSARQVAITQESLIWGTMRYETPQSGWGTGMPIGPNMPEEMINRSAFIMLFPTCAIQVWDNQLTVLQIIPVGPDHTEERLHLYFFGDAAHDDEHAGVRNHVVEAWRKVNGEDIAACEQMQIGRTSPGFDGGILSPYWDTPTQHFSRLVLEALIE